MLVMCRRRRTCACELMCSRAVSLVDLKADVKICVGGRCGAVAFQTATLSRLEVLNLRLSDLFLSSRSDDFLYLRMLGLNNLGKHFHFDVINVPRHQQRRSTG